MQTDPRILANLLVKLTRMNTLRYRGGHGGAYPCGASSRLCSPPRWVPWAWLFGTSAPEDTTPLGAMGANPMWGLAQGPWPPQPLGRYTRERQRRGVDVYPGCSDSSRGLEVWCISPPVPYGISSPDGPQYRGSL